MEHDIRSWQFLLAVDHFNTPLNSSGSCFWSHRRRSSHVRKVACVCVLVCMYVCWCLEGRTRADSTNGKSGFRTFRVCASDGAFTLDNMYLLNFQLWCLRGFCVNLLVNKIAEAFEKRLRMINPIHNIATDNHQSGPQHFWLNGFLVAVCSL